jgi:hypothetical protein
MRRLTSPVCNVHPLHITNASLLSRKRELAMDDGPGHIARWEMKGRYRSRIVSFPRDPGGNIGATLRWWNLQELRFRLTP